MVGGLVQATHATPPSSSVGGASLVAGLHGQRGPRLEGHQCGRAPHHWPPGQCPEAFCARRGGEAPGRHVVRDGPVGQFERGPDAQLRHSGVCRLVLLPITIACIGTICSLDPWPMPAILASPMPGSPASVGHTLARRSTWSRSSMPTIFFILKTSKTKH